MVSKNEVTFHKCILVVWLSECCRGIILRLLNNLGESSLSLVFSGAFHES
jgi:hypothetical protein